MNVDDENSMYSIMIIDDDESIGNMEQELLEREEYLVQRAYSGTEALLLLQQKRPDLILLDLMLPGISGKSKFVIWRGSCGDIIYLSEYERKR